MVKYRQNANSIPVKEVEIYFLFHTTNTAFWPPEYKNRFCSPNYQEFFILTICNMFSNKKQTDPILKVSIFMVGEDSWIFGRGVWYPALKMELCFVEETPIVIL